MDSIVGFTPPADRVPTAAQQNLRSVTALRSAASALARFNAPTSVLAVLEAATLSEDWIAAMRSRAFLLEAHHTTHIEGTRLTLDEAARVLGGEEVPGADPDDARELLN